MSKHTPGPWTAGPTMHGKWHCIFAPSNAGEVARTESAANARLIAAAPELVECVEAFLSGPEAPRGMAVELLKRIRGYE